MSGEPIRVGPATDAERFLATEHTVWFQEVSADPPEQQLLGLAERLRYAVELPDGDPRTYAGVYAVYPMTLSVPGADAGSASVPCAGLSWVGVHPDHRRRGVLAAMMRHHLEQVHVEKGTFVSALHASEPAIYGRFGYGSASLEQEVELGRGTTLTAPGLDDEVATVTTQLATLSDPGMAARLRTCHLEVATVGAIVGDDTFYEKFCYEAPEDLRGHEAWRVLFARREGVDVGFAVIRRAQKWEKHRPGGELAVWAVVGGPAAQLALFRRLVDFDLMGAITVNRVGFDDPLLLWTGGPRSTSDVGVYDGLWVRLVDLPDALQQRAYARPCDVVVEVDDTAAPWNQGRWRIHVDDAGQATVEQTSADAHLRLPVQALGGAYLGAGNLVALHHAGVVTERRPGAVAEFWRSMRTDLAPGAAFAF